MVQEPPDAADHVRAPHRREHVERVLRPASSAYATGCRDFSRNRRTNSRASRTGTRESSRPWITKNGGASELIRSSGEAAM
ncbi:hypothetical protein H4696_004189 [Amycolatopsis lexingtonensis]|uniref:Uncharacterized protein n=1 Tax=Amycolatopsis lexingtonensis TaxID=218822 RepID=A0ABR9I1M9_9PSEU|nr:hypothetical protein [Amycolatopsis lexingtonensis]